MVTKARHIEESALRSADLVRQLLAFARKQTVAGMLKLKFDSMNNIPKRSR